VKLRAEIFAFQQNIYFELYIIISDIVDKKGEFSDE